ncbi:MAG: alpha/beta fold hydrolase [Bryobacteraceae bacterium]
MRRISCLCSLLVSLLPRATAADSRSIADAVFDELLRQDFSAVAARFAPQMSAALPQEKLAAAVGPVLKSLGALKGSRPQPQVSSTQGVEVYTFPAIFENARMNVVVAVDAQGRVAGLRLMPPPPEPPKPGELVVKSGDLKLPAVLTVPEGPGPFPVVVLVHGSGPHDQDETVAANAPFRDLAEGLAARGVATLRYVKRTKQYPQRPVTTVQEEVIEDALNAVALARKQSRIDPKRVFVLGHSLGGYLAPRIATSDPSLAGLILLAANARPVLDLAREQLEYLAAPPETIEKLRAAAPPSYWADLEKYDPLKAAAKLTQPVLILQGERDYQVTMKDFELWKGALAGRKDVVLKSYPKLNHLFLEGEGKSLPADYAKPGHIPDYVLDDIAAFVRHPPGK